MENNVKAKLIVETFKRFTDDAIRQYINAEADLARAKAGSDLWEKDPVNDFGWNPYDVIQAQKVVEKTREEKYAREEVLAYAIDVFLEKIPGKKEEKE